MVRNICKILQNFEVLIFRFHRTFISPILKMVFSGGCRFEPTCSEYAIKAVERYGPFKGFFLAVVRFIRCSPLSKHPREYPLV